MDLLSAFAIGAAGMQVEQTRFNVAALNLANANSVRAADGTMFQPLRVVSGPKPGLSFQSVLDRIGTLNGGTTALAPQVISTETTNNSPRLMFDPGHPSADERGFVALPAVNTMLEMMTLMTAQRAYEANVVAINAAKSMVMKSMEIGGNT